MTDLSTKKENKNLPLVSVFVITYNSAETILDALESVKNQTYQNIELVISDDCSKDNTVEICKNWIEQNKQHFTNTILVTSEKNTGVAPNCNRAVKASSGEWLKVLAGDDLLPKNSIEEYVNFILKNINVDIVFSATHFWGDDPIFTKEVKEHIERTFYPKIKQDWKHQYKSNLKSFYLPGPTIFYSKKLYNDIGGYDEKYPMNEEDSFAFSVLDKGYHIMFLDKELYSYRVSHSSLCRGENKQIHYGGRETYYWDIIRPRLKQHKMYYDIWYRDYGYKIAHIKEEKSFIKKYKVYLFYIIHPRRYRSLLKKVITKLFIQESNK